MNPIKTCIRNFKHNPGLLFVYLPGLAIGLAAFLLWMVYIKHEISYYQHFETKDRVVWLHNQIIEENSVETDGISMRKAFTEIPTQVPEIEKATQVYRGWEQTLKRGEDHFINEELFNTLNAQSIFGTKPLSDIHIHTKAGWDLSRIGIIILIAFLAVFILRITIINFINLLGSEVVKTHLRIFIYFIVSNHHHQILLYEKRFMKILFFLKSSISLPYFKRACICSKYWHFIGFLDELPLGVKLSSLSIISKD